MESKKDAWKKNTNAIIKFFTILSSIGFWGFILFFTGLHWAYILPPIVSDFEIQVAKSSIPDNGLYANGDSFIITFSIFNEWNEPIDAEFEVNKNKCIIMNYSCTGEINNECQSSPNLNKEFMLKDFERTQYVTIKGKFIDCEDTIDLCLNVDEPTHNNNQESECITFNPSGLKRFQ